MGIVSRGAWWDKFPRKQCYQLRLICAALKTRRSDSKLPDEAKQEVFSNVLFSITWFLSQAAIELTLALMLQIVFTFSTYLFYANKHICQVTLVTQENPQNMKCRSARRGWYHQV